MGFIPDRFWLRHLCLDGDRVAVVSTQHATVEVAQWVYDRRWRIRLIYDDGETYMSRASYATKEEAEAAAFQWTLENVLVEGPPQ